MPLRYSFLIAAAGILLGSHGLAQPPKVESVSAVKRADVWRFDVTLSHPDTGWDHYADGWRVLAPDGSVLGTRILAHPHVDEQPFTRSLSGVEIPDSLETVLIQARDNIEGWAQGTTTFALPKE